MPQSTMFRVPPAVEKEKTMEGWVTAQQAEFVILTQKTAAVSHFSKSF